MTEMTGKLFVLEASGGGRLFSLNPDGSEKTVLVTGCAVPEPADEGCEPRLLLRGVPA